MAIYENILLIFKCFLLISFEILFIILHYTHLSTNEDFIMLSHLYIQMYFLFPSNINSL